MKKNAGFKATAVLLSFLLVLQISPITAWADELNSSASETVSSQLPSGEAEGGSASDFQEPGVSSEIPGTASSRESSSVEGTASSETASETVSEQESGPSSDTEASSQEASGSQAEASGPEKETTPESLEELVASVLVTNGNENPINEPDLASQYGYELPPAEEKETYEILGEDTSLREESIKYFRLKDGGYLAAGYPVPVHYEDKETGEFLEINNDLEKTAIDGETYYTNADNPFEVSLPENLSAGQPIIVSQDENSIGLTYLPNEDGHVEAAADSGILAAPPQKPAASASPGGNIQITNRVGAVKTAARPLTRAVTAEQKIEESNEAMQKAEKVESKALYETEPNISFEYRLVGNYLKENIIIKEKSALEPFRFALNTNGMTAELQENRSVLIFNEAEEETAFLMNAPFMYDAAGARTSEVEVTLTETANGYLYTMTPSEEWLSDPARAYPVTVDPHIEKITSYANVKDTTVSFKTRGATVGASSLESSAEIAYLKVGRQYNGNELGAAVYFAVPSNIPKSARIVQAKMAVGSYRGGLSTSPSDTQINAYRITSDWNVGNIKENKVLYTDSSPKTPSYDSAALDYFIYNDSAASSEGTWKEIDITRAVQEWVNGTPNYGILLRGVNLPSSGDRLARFYDSDNGVENSDPQYAFWYRDTRGLEDYWSYHSHSAGIAGNGYLNDFNGNLVFLHDDASTVSDLMPVTVSHVYNSSASNEASRFGNGWRLNVMQTLEAVKSGSGVDPAQYPYVYTDEDGTKHYFYKDTKDGNKIKDEDGMGMEYSAYPNPTYDLKHQITLKDKTKLIFGTDSYLRRIIDTNGNTIQFQYGPRSDGNFLGYITDAVGNRIIMTYTSDYSKLTKITDESTGRVTSFQYDSAGNLTSITHSDGGKAVYTYFGKLLNSVTDPAGYGMRYYYLGNTFRVYKIQERYNGAVSQSMELDFSKVNQTTFTTHGMDGNYDTEGDNQVITYQFDNFGHPVAVQDQDGNANKYQYDTDDEKEPHKLMKASSMQKPVLNLLKNPDMGGAWGVYDNNGGEVTRKTDTGHLGKNCYQIVKSGANGTTNIYQVLSLKKGTYTYSAYVKTENVKLLTGGNGGAGIWAAQKRSDGSYIKWHTNRSLTGTTDTDFDDGWVRLTQTFTVAQDNTLVEISAGMSNASGTLYVDSAQLETGEVANKLNLIKNSGFQSTTNGKLDHWSFSETPAGSGVGSPPSHTQAALINPTISGRPKFSQAINVQGKEGDVYSLSGWASTTGAKPGGEFRIAAAFIFDGAPAQWFTAPFNESVTGWQFANGIGVADDGDPTTTRTYSAIHVYVFYKDQLNPVYIDNLQLVKDNGHSYVYDDDGNVTSSADAAEDSNFNYDDHSNLKQMVDVSGNHFGYHYDDKENLTDARNSDGVSQKFTYESHGLPTEADVYGNSHMSEIKNGGNYRIRNALSGKYLEVKGAIDANGTKVQQYQYNGGANQHWKLVKDINGTYKFYTKTGGGTRIIDIDHGYSTDGTTMSIYDPGNKDWQRFILEYAGGNAYRIVPKHAPNMALAPTGGSTGNSVFVVLKTKNESAVDQLWYFENPDVTISAVPKAGDTISIRSRLTGKYFDVKQISTADNALINQYYYNGGKNQRYTLEAVPGQDGWFYIHSGTNYDKVLQVTTALVDGNKTVRQFGKDGGDDQKFSFTKNSDGTYRITCKAYPSESLGVPGDSFNASITTVSTAHTSSQGKQWILETVSYLSSSASYTSDGRHISSVTDSRGTKTSYTYDSKNRMNTGVTIGSGSDAQSTSYAYDGLDRVTSVSSGGSTAGYGYEDYRLSTVTHNGFSYTFGYDGYGNNTSVAVGGRTLTTNTFNLKAGLPAGSTYGNGDTVTYSYDNKERLVGKSFNGTPAVSYKYDAMGSLVETEDLLNNISFKTQYDLINRVTGVTSSDGGEYRISYDDQNRIDATLEKIAGVTLKNEYQYSDTSIIEGIKLNGSQILTYDWDDLTRMTSRTLKLTAPFTTQYTYLKGSNAGGETTLVAEIKNGGETLSYTYDQFGNIVSVSQNGTVVESYEYDGLNQLIKVTNGANVTEYAYDAGGNLTSVKLNGEVQDTYGYTDAGWKDLLTSFNGQAITYDEIGNPLTYRDGYQFTWQHGRRLATVSHGSNSISYTYDPDGIRTSKTVNGTTTKYHVMNGTLLGQTKGSDTIVFLYDEKGNKYGFDYNGTKYYYIFNVQGDVIGILNQAGQKIVSYTYDPWGKVLSVDGSEAFTIGQINPIRYRSYYYDTETGFYYLQSRYYDPTTRRFLNIDDYVDPNKGIDGLNLFVYSKNNPINFVDPNGHAFFSILLLSALVVGMAAFFTSSSAQVEKPTIDPSKPPPPETGYQPPKRNPNPSKVPNPNGPGRGWPSRSGSVWVPDNSMHGGPGWTEQFPDGSHVHHYPNGNVRKIESLTVPSFDPVVGVGMMVIGVVVIAAVVLDDATGVGTADNFLIIPIGDFIVNGAQKVFS